MGSVVVDRASRDRLALLLRRLASGRLKTYDFEVEAHPLIYSNDPAILPIVDTVSVFFCDLRGPRLIGRKALNADERRAAARMVVFLRSDVVYEWPPMPSTLDALLWLLSFGRAGSRNGSWRDWERAGDHEAWPFIRTADCARAAAHNPFGECRAA